jgi:UDP-glucose 4-epimerase
LNKKAIKLTIPLGLVGFLSSLLETTYGIFNSTPTLNRDKFLTLRAKNWKCDISDTIKDLNYKPKLDLETGLKESIAWFKREKWLH